MAKMEAKLRTLARSGSADVQLDAMASCAILISLLSSAADVEGNNVVGEACTSLVSVAASASAAYMASGRATYDLCSSALAFCLPVGDAHSIYSPVAVRARAQMLCIVSHIVCSPEARLWPPNVHGQAVQMAEAIAAVMPAEVFNSTEMWNVYEASVRSKGQHGVEASARFVARAVRGDLGDAPRVVGVLKLVSELHGADVMPEDYRLIFNRELRRRSRIVAEVQEHNRSLSAFAHACDKMITATPGWGAGAKSVMSMVRHQRGCAKICCNGGCANVEGPAAYLVKLRRCAKDRGLVYCSDACHREAWSRCICPCRARKADASNKM